MIAVALRAEVQEDRGLLRWILPSSLALHLLAFAWLPSARRAPSLPPPPLVVEVADPPPPADPPPKPAEPEREPTRAPRTIANVAPRAAAQPAQQTVAPIADAPMDFTSTVFSNDGPGLAIGVPASQATVASGPRPTVASPLSSAPPASRVVSPSSLARRPRAPGLDTELERQYPTVARRSGISGSAVLRVRILPDGRIGEVHLLSESWTGFGPACERTVRAARWEPPIDRDGTPVTTEITYTCRFEVRS